MSSSAQAKTISITDIQARDAISFQGTYQYKLSKNLRDYYYANKRKDGKCGLVQPAHFTLARLLVSLLTLHMENVRKDDPDRYRMLMSRHYNRLPVETNRKQILAMYEEKEVPCCLDTITNRIDRLMDAGFILKKEHTSRTKKKVIINGQTVLKTVITPNGRGNQILWISKTWLWITVEQAVGNQKSDNNDPNPEIRKIIENEALIQSKTEPFGQSHRDKTGNLENHDNNGSKGVPPEHQQQAPAPAVTGNEKTGNDPTKLPRTGIARKISEIFPNNFFTNPENPEPVSEKPKKGKASSDSQASADEKDYLKKIALANRLAELAENPLDYYAYMLWIHMHSALYGNKEFLDVSEQTAIKLLRLHLQRLVDQDSRRTLKTAYKMLSRAVYLADRWLNRENEKRTEKGIEKFYLYPPGTYLSVDVKTMKTGCFRIVVDHWLKDETERRANMSQKGTRLVQFQYALSRQDALAQRVIDELRTNGFGNAYHALHQGFDTLKRNLDTHCDQLTDQLKQEILDGYTHRSFFVRNI